MRDRSQGTIEAFDRSEMRDTRPRTTCWYSLGSWFPHQGICCVPTAVSPVTSARTPCVPASSSSESLPWGPSRPLPDCDSHSVFVWSIVGRLSSPPRGEVIGSSGGAPNEHLVCTGRYWCAGQAARRHRQPQRPGQGCGRSGTPTPTRASTSKRQRRLLCEFVDGDVSSGGDEDAERVIDGVVARHVVAQDDGVEFAATLDDDVIVPELVAGRTNRSGIRDRTGTSACLPSNHDHQVA